MGVQHHFSVNAACEVGVNAAIILENLVYWIEHNAANRTHYHDGRYWTYNSVQAFAELFPYLSRKVVRTSLDKLVDGGYVVTGEYNQDKRKRTKWYSVTEEGYALREKRPKGTLHLPLGANAIAREGNSLYISTDSKQADSLNTSDGGSERNKCTDEQSESIREIIDYLNDRLGTRFTYRNDKTNGMIRERMREGFSVEDFKTVIDKKAASWKGTEYEKFLRPSTLFAPSHFEEYLNERSDGATKPRVDYSEFAIESFKRL